MNQPSLSLSRITDAEMLDAGFTRLPDGSWHVPPAEISTERLQRLYDQVLRPVGHSQDTGRRNICSRSQNDGIVDDTNR
jgi:hypothetical protein